MSANNAMDDSTTKQLQAKMLEMLLTFMQFCKEHNLVFYLIGGSAIGAVREHGFVPWDDDIDIAMPRPDYERFKLLWEQYGQKYVYCRSDEKVNYHHCVASLRDPQTTFISSYNKNIEICHGIMIDIIPFDACPDSWILRQVQIFWAFVFALFNNQRLPNNKGTLFRRVAWVLFKMIRSRKIRYRIWRYAEKQMSKYNWSTCNYARESVSSVRGMFELYSKEDCEQQVWFDFEGHKVPLMRGYKQYLTMGFGDYMKRPPESQRKGKHILEFVDLEHPYTHYRGIKYFPGIPDDNGAM